MVTCNGVPRNILIKTNGNLLNPFAINIIFGFSIHPTLLEFTLQEVQ